MRWGVAILWAVFALLLVIGAKEFLYACGIVLGPYAQSYCTTPIDRRPSIAEAERAEQLQRQIHFAELRLAEKPDCSMPLTPPTPIPAVTPATGPGAPLRVPHELDDLKGCWISNRGDIQLYNVVTGEPTKKVRFCFCFGDGGNGTLKIKSTNGFICEGSVTASLQDRKLHIDQPHVHCSDGDFIDHEITCSGQNRTAVCSGRSNEYPKSNFGQEEFYRAEQSLCD